MEKTQKMGEGQLWGGNYEVQADENERERLLQQLSSSAIWTDSNRAVEALETSTEACTVEDHDAVHEDTRTDEERGERQTGQD